MILRMMEIYLRQSCVHNMLISLILKETEELKLDMKKYIFLRHPSYDMISVLFIGKNLQRPSSKGAGLCHRNQILKPGSLCDCDERRQNPLFEW